MNTNDANWTRSTGAGRSAMRTLLAAAVALAVAATVRPALGAGVQPTGVVAGSATFQQNGSNVVIRAANNTIINYSRFDIPAGSQVQFIQPSATARVLNRIDSTMPSKLDGALLANGIVYFSNPSGIIFGPNSVVNVGQIYAAAGTISNANFMANINQFTNNTGAVINSGAINAQAVHLVGARVANFGSIVAPDGVVTMTSGSDVYIGDVGSHVVVKVSGAPTAGTVDAPAVENAGTIEAGHGMVSMGAGDVYALATMAVRNTGTIQARDVALTTGKNGVTEVGGTIDASDKSGPGGTVRVLGEQVILQGAQIDASGAAGGGTVLVGGNAHGAGPEMNARATYVSPDSVIRADALTLGNGGTVVVWSNEYTYFAGAILARGAGAGGNGGMAEVSGKDYLAYEGFTNLTAPRGAAGTLLLDPTDVNIVSGATDTPAPTISGGGTHTITYPTNPGTASLSVTTLQNQLNAANVTVDATSGTGAPNGGAIDVQASFAWTTAHNLILQSGTTITVENGIGITTPAAGTSNITFTAGTDVTINGTLTLQGAGAFASTGANFTLNGNIFTNTASVTINHGGAVAINGQINAGSATNNGLVTINANNAGTGGTAGFSMGSSASIVTSNTSANAVKITVNNGAAGTGGAVLGSISTGVATGGGGTITVDTSAGSGGGAITFVGGAGTLNTLDTAVAPTGAVTLLTPTGTAGIGATGAGNAIPTKTATISLTTGSGGMFVTDSVSGTYSGSTAGGNVALTTTGASSTLTVGGTGVTSASGAGTLTLTGGGGIVINGNVGGGTYTGAATLSTGAGSISGAGGTITADSVTLAPATAVGTSGTAVRTSTAVLTITAPNFNVNNGITTDLTNLTITANPGAAGFWKLAASNLSGFNVASTDNTNFTTFSGTFTGGPTFSFHATSGSIQAGTMNVSATGVLLLTADGTGASIGSSGTALATTALTVTALATTNVFIDNTVGASFNVAAGGNIGLTTDAGILHVVTGTLAGTPGVQTSGGGASTITLAGHGGISLEENLGASTYGGTITLTAAAGNIVETSGKMVTAGTLHMTAGGAGAEVGVSGTPIATTAGTITAGADTGGVFITNSGAGSFTATAVGAGKVQLATTSGTLTINGATTTGSGNILLTSPDGIAINAAVGGGAYSGTITINANTDTTAGGDFTMSGAGSLATTNAAGTPVVITVNTGAAGTGSATLGSIAVGNGATISVDTSNGGNTTGGSILFGSGTVNAGATGTVLLTTGGAASGIGAGGAMQVTAATVTASSGTAGVAVTDSVAGSFNVNSGGDVTLTTTAGILQVVTGTLANAGVQSTGATSNVITLTGAGGVQIHAPVGGAGFGGTIAINAVTGNFAQDTGAGALISTTNATAGAVAIGVNTGGGGAGTATVGTITVASGGKISVDTSDGGVDATGGNITKAGAADVLTAGAAGTVRLVVGDTTTAGAIGASGAGNEVDTNAGKLVLNASNFNVTNTPGTVVTLLDISTRIVAGGFRTLSLNANWTVNITDDGVSVFTPSVSNTTDNPTFNFTGLEGGSAAGAVTVAIPGGGINVGTGTVNLTAIGGDINNAAGGVITAGTLGAFASSGTVGAVTELLTFAGTIRSISGAGGTSILSGSATGASFNINSAGSIFAGNVNGTVTSADLGLASPGIVSTAGAGSISLGSVSGVNVNAPVGGASYGGAILVQSNSGNFVQATGAGAKMSTTNTSGTAIQVFVNFGGDGPGTATLGTMAVGSGGTIKVDTTNGGGAPSGGSIIAAGAADSLNAGTGVITLTTGVGGAQGIGGSGAGQTINTAAATLNLTTGSGGIFISNTAATTTLGTLSVAGGSVHIASTGDMAVPAVTTLSGSFNFTSTTGALTVSGILSASGDVTLSGTTVALQASVSSGGTGTVTATAGAISQTAGKLTAPTLVLSATGDIVGPFSISTETLTAGTTGGSIDLLNTPTGSVQVMGLHTKGGTINYDQTSGGDLTLVASGSGGTGISSGDATHFGGDVTFKNDFGGGNNTINALIDTTGNGGTGGTLSLSGGGLTVGVNPTLGKGNVTLGAKGLDLVITVPLTNAITLSAARDIIISSSVSAKVGNDLSIIAGSSGVGGVWVQSTGTVTGDPGHNVTLQGQSLFAAGASGEAVRIDSGGQLTSSGSLTIMRTLVSSATTMTINGNLDAGAGGISITGEARINLGGTLTTTGGPITLSTGGIFFNPFLQFVNASPVQLTTNSALITTGSAATGAAIDLGVGAVGNTHDLVLDGGTAGTVSLGTTTGVGNLTIRTATFAPASSLSAGTIRIVSADVVNQLGGTITATSALGVRAAGDVTLNSVATPSLAVETTGSNILLANTGTVDIGTVTADTGALFTATSGVTASGVGPNSINLSATGSITQSAGTIDAGATGAITLASNAAGGLGTLLNPLQTSAAGGTLTITGGVGGAFISHAGDVAVTGSAVGGDINIASTGDITQSGVTRLTGSTITLTVTGAHKIGTSTPSAAPILTSAPVVTATSGSGEILINNNVTAIFAVSTTGDVTLTTTSGNLLTAATGTFAANNLTLTSAGGISVQGTTTVGGVLTATTGAGATFANTGTITIGTTGSVINADAFNSLATITVTPGGGTLTVLNVTLGQQVALGADDSGGTLGITAEELANLHAPLLVIGQTGASATGTISIAGNVAAASGTTLHLISGNQIHGTGGTLTADSLALTASAAVNNMLTAVGSLAVSSGGPVTVTNSVGGANTLTIAGGAGIDGVVGITGVGPITLTESTGSVSIAGNLSAGANTVAITLGGVDKMLATTGTTTITGTAGITLAADHMNLSGTGTIDGTGATVTLKPNLSTDAVNFSGGPVAGTLTLPSAALATVKADLLVIGQVGGGTVSLNAAIAPAQVTTLHLEGSTITGAGAITVGSLALSSAGTINVTTAVTNLGATSGSGGMTISNTTGSGNLHLLVGGVDGVIGLDAGTGALALTETAAGALLTQSAPIHAGTNVAMIADRMALGNTITTGGIVTLAPHASRAINLGAATDAVVATLELSATEINEITAPRLVIGGAAASAITITAPIAPTGTSVLTLNSAGPIVNGGPGTDLTVINLSLLAGNGIGAATPLTTQVTNLAFQNAAGAIQISNSGALNIAAVGGLGTSTNAGTTTSLSTASPLVFTVNTTSAGALSATATADLTVNTGVTVSSGAGITFVAGGNIILAAGSTVTSTGGAIPMSFTSTGGGQITFNESMGGGGSISTFTTNTTGVVVFQGNAQEVDATNSITFLPAFATHPAYATVARPAGDMTLRVNSGGTITFAPGSNFAVVGNMDIEAPGGTATVGDLSALGNIVVNAAAINLQSRAADGRSGDEGLDVVAGGTLSFSVVPIATNPALGIISFATTSGQNTDDLHQTLIVAFGLRHQAPPVAAGDFGTVPTMNDLIAAGPTNTSIVQSLAGVIPRSVETLSPERGQSVSGAARDMLREMGVFGRDLTDEELVDALLGYISSDDSPKKVLPKPQDYTVASNRLPYAPVVPTIELYQELFFGPKLDANGQPVLDSKGKVVRDATKPQDEAIRKSLTTAWKAYLTKAGDAAPPAGFRAFLRESGDKEALDYLDRLRDLITAIQQLGLTTVEFNVSKTILVSRVKPQGVNVSQFTIAIMSSGEPAAAPPPTPADGTTTTPPPAGEAATQK